MSPQFNRLLNLKFKNNIIIKPVQPTDKYTIKNFKSV